MSIGRVNVANGTITAGSRVELTPWARERFGITPGRRGTVVRVIGGLIHGGLIYVCWDGKPSALHDETSARDLRVTAERPDWTTMRAEDFDASLPLTLFDPPSTPVESTGDDLLSLLDT